MKTIKHAGPDYSNLKYWAAHPLKVDPSDSVPIPLHSIPGDTSADVFFIHPTTFTGKNEIHLTNAPLEDEFINNKTDRSSILYQASIFNASCKVYAPRYRQAYLQMYYEKDSTTRQNAFDFAYNDVRAAFQYYLDSLNHGRPIIIASHSQGTTHAKKLIKEFFEDKPLRSQLVCAYLVGMPVEKNFYTSIPPCQDSLSTGCITSWRTYRNGYLKNGVSNEDTSLITTNPVTWTPGTEVATRDLHKGAILYKFNSIAEHPNSTVVAGNALWISKPKFKGGVFYFQKNYHIGDFNLFYLNVREDVARRIRIYQQKPNHNIE
ncbi:DUF3089 domain-containing protein [Pollutibacter soli]|uniref:DUF3089 domain-containing protein n=1 Tax=Pollutibacter soli TaxID=3034157 RepID=UPI003013F5C4